MANLIYSVLSGNAAERNNGYRSCLKCGGVSHDSDGFACPYCRHGEFVKPPLGVSWGTSRISYGQRGRLPLKGWKKARP